MNTFNILWEKLSNLGLQGEVSTNRLIKIRFVNQALVVAVTLLSVLIIVTTFTALKERTTLLLLGFNLIAFIGLAFAAIRLHHLIMPFIFSVMTAGVFFAYFFGAIEIALFFIFTPLSVATYYILDSKMAIIYNGIFIGTIITCTIISAIYYPQVDEFYADVAIFTISLFVMMAVMYFVNREILKYQKELKLQEEIINKAQTLANIGSWVYSFKADRLDWTAQMYKIFDISKQETLSYDRHFVRFLPQEFQEKVKQIQQIDAEIDSFDFVCKLVGVGGSSWYRFVAKREYNEEEKSYELFGIVQDITSQKEAEMLQLMSENLQGLNTELVRSNQELEEFAYIASHDLQEPLRMVGNFVELLGEEYNEQLGEDGKMYISYAVNGVKRMSRQIDDLLEYSRVGRREVAMQVVDMEELIDNKLFEMLARIKSKNAKVVMSSVPNEVRCEPMQMSLVFQNLINNALKFNNNDTPVISITGEERPNDYLFSVKDNGIGIDKNNQEKIFKIFKRLHRKEEYAGTGIGLAMVKRIILRHGGNIWVESELGKGSVFYFTISKEI